MSVTKYRTRLELRHDGQPADPATVLKRVHDWIISVERRPTDLPAEGGETTVASGATIAHGAHRSDVEQQVAIRYSRPDPTQGVRWITDFGVRSTSTATVADIGLAMVVDDPTKRHPQIRPPRVIGTFLQDFDAYAGLRLLGVPDETDAGRVTEFIEFVGSPDRVLPTIVVSVDPFSEKPLLKIDELILRVRGLAHVVLLTKRAAMELASALEDLIGSQAQARLWTVYNGAVRLYWPSLDVRSPAASPFDHRLWLPQDVYDGANRVMGDLFALVAWGANHRDVPNWLDVTAINRARDLRRVRELERTLVGEKEAAAEYVELFKFTEAQREEAEAERLAAKQERDEAVERARTAERAQEELRYRAAEMAESIQELRDKVAALTRRAELDCDLLVTQYASGTGEHVRGCVDQLLATYTDEAHEVREALDWLGSSENWRKNPGKRLESLGKGLFEYRVNVKDHWFRLYCAQLTRLRTVVVVHAYAKKQNKLDDGETKVARKRLGEALSL